MKRTMIKETASTSTLILLILLILTMCICISCKDESSNQLKRNNVGDVDNVGDSFVNVADVGNSSVDAHYVQAEVLFGKGDFHGALMELNMSKPSSQREFLMGSVYQKTHRYKRAIDSYMNMKSLSNSESNKTAKSAKSAIFSNIAKSYFELGLLYKRIAKLGASIERDYKIRRIFNFNTLANSQFNLASAYYKDSNLKPSEKNYLVGLCYLESERFDEAVRSLHAAFAIADESIKAKSAVKLGEAWYKNGFQEKATRVWKQNLDENRGDNSEIEAEMAQTYCRLNVNLDQVIGICNKRDFKKPGVFSKTVASVYLKIASQNHDMAMLSEAIRLFEKNRLQESGYSLEANDPILLIDLAEAYYQRRIFGESAMIISGFLSEHPEISHIFNAIQTISEMRRRT